MTGSITSLGIGSGIDLNGMLAKIVQVERQPIVALQAQQKVVQSKLSALGTFRSSLSSLQDASRALYPLSGFAVYSSSSSSSAVSVTASQSSAVGNYSVDVVALAKNQRVSSAAAGLSASSPVAEGTLSFEIGKMDGGAYTPSTSFSIDVSAGATLSSLRDSINAQGKNFGVSASILNGVDGARLVVSSDKGTDGVLRISGDPSLSYDPVTGTGGFSQSAPGGQAASDARFVVNGVEGKSSTNVVRDFADGMTFNLSAVTSETVSVSVSSSSTESAVAAAKSFVAAFNAFAEKSGTLSSYDRESGKAGVLQGVSVVSSVRDGLRSALRSADAVGEFSSAFQLGISVDAKGRMSLDEKKLVSALSSPNGEKFLASVGRAFESVATKALAPDGALSVASESFDLKISSLSKRMDDMELRVSAVQKRYAQQFASLDTLLSSMSSTSSWLSAQLAGLPSR